MTNVATMAATGAARVLPATDEIVAADGTRLFCRDWGSGRPVVFLSGWALSSAMWGSQMMHLVERGARCIAYDRRGHGRSTDPGRGYDYDTLADDLAAVMEQRELERATLVGHSMAGGEIVRYLSRQGPRRVGKIVLLAPTTPFPQKTPDNPGGYERAMFDQLRAALLDDYPGWLDANAGPFFTPNTRPGTVAWVKDMMLQGSLHALVGCFDAMVSTDFRAELATVTVPALVIHGDCDQSAPLDITGRPTAGLLPPGRLIVVEGAPHGLFVTHGDQVNTELERFVLA